MRSCKQSPGVIFMQNELERYRIDAASQVELYQRRYREGGRGVDFIAIAQRWSAALHRQALDATELSDVIRDAERYEGVSDIAFYAFINDMRSIYHWLCEQGFSRGFAPMSKDLD